MHAKNQRLSRPQMGHVQLYRLGVRGGTGAGGLVAPLPCTAYLGKLAILFGCSLPRRRPSSFVPVSHDSLA